MAHETVDHMLRVIFNSMSEEVIDTIPAHELAGLIAGLWTNFNKDAPMYAHDICERVEQICSYRKELHKLRQLPYIAQRTEEWYALRRHRLTASDTAQALGKGKFASRDQLIQKKVQDIRGKSVPFKVMAPMKWGIMFEAMAMRCYQQANDNVGVHEFGMIPHSTLSCFGASPDGITDLGIMTEIKCPYKRKITGEVPDYYELQMQGQMAVCNLKECDYIECDMQTFDSYDDYVTMVEDSQVNHGVICEFIRGTETYYEYSDPLLTAPQANAWAREFSSVEMRRDKDIQLVKMHFWRLRKMSVIRVHFDADRWNTIVPQIRQFWDDVQTALQTEEQDNDENVVHAEDKKKYKFIPESDED